MYRLHYESESRLRLANERRTYCERTGTFSELEEQRRSIWRLVENRGSLITLRYILFEKLLQTIEKHLVGSPSGSRPVFIRAPLTLTVYPK